MTATTLFALLGCHGKDTDGGTDGVPTESGLIEDSGELVADSGAEVDPCTETGEFTTTISGDVTVSLWVPGADGERESISFEESYDGTFPFGGIWITAYEEDSAGDPVYLGETVVKTPDIAGDAWSLTVTSEACREVWIHAVLDEDG
ncbi:MAG: hypothetical protein GY884_10060, partial [Proteobacteria bacterium]|nr:hypothetical protein [Pseudomonadota bacterium]